MVDDSRKRRALALSAFFRATIKLNLHLFDVLYNKLYNKSMTKSTTNRKVHNKPTTDSQQIDSWSKASNKSTTSWHYILSSLSKQCSLAFDFVVDFTAVAGVQSCVSAAAAAAHYVISNLVLSSSRTLGLSMMLLYTPHWFRHGVFVLTNAKFRLLEHVQSNAVDLLGL